MSATNPIKGQDMVKCKAPFQACNCIIVLFQVDVICPHND